MSQSQPQNPQLFTCLSCTIAFVTAEDQRVHYRSDHHRYNMKRRVASLPPLSEAVFNQKVIERRTETAVMSSLKGSTCEICSKVYTTEGAYRSHINSKKHKENELKAAANPKPPVSEVPSTSTAVPVESLSTQEPRPPSPPTSEDEAEEEAEDSKAEQGEDADEDEDEIMQTIDQKIAAARSRLTPNHCLFCPIKSDSLAANLTHMSQIHSFFIPDADYLIDLPGLIGYLGEKIAVGNVCIFCNGKGREFRTVEAVRKHMVDKSHCKIAYSEEEDKLEVSDYYDFTSSYPAEALEKEKRKGGKKAPSEKELTSQTEEWEDLDDDDEDAEVDEVVDEDASSDADEDEEDDNDEDDSDDLPDNQITYGDSSFELVLPSGARIGHRSMRRYYAQSFPGSRNGGKEEDPKSGAALVRRLLADKNSALVPRKGGFGAFGAGTQVVKARNRGEAREAGRHVREFRDMKRKEDFRTRVGFIHNAQKHYRDPLLQ